MLECELNILLFLDVDLYRLYRVVDRLGGHTRVTNKNLWKQVGRKLGFENTWSTNQVRVKISICIMASCLHKKQII